MGYWRAYATYDDGTEIDTRFPYNDGDNYNKECETQYAIECWLMAKHEGCNFYSVSYEED